MVVFSQQRVLAVT